MSFFEKMGLGRFFGKKKDDDTENINLTDDAQNGIPKFSDDAKETLVKFKFNDETYILEEFDLNFDQEIGAKGEVVGRPRGGIMTVVLRDTPSRELNDWIQKIDVVIQGEINIYPYKSKVDESVLMSIKFFDAYCIHYEKKMNIATGLHTTLVISPKSVKIGGQEFENNWKMDKPLSHNIKTT